MNVDMGCNKISILPRLNSGMSLTIAHFFLSSLHRSPHWPKNRIILMLGRLRIQVLMMEGFDFKNFKAFPFKKWNKSHQQSAFLFWTVKLSVLVQFHLFPGFCKVRVASYTSVQSLLKVLIPNLLCLKPCACVSDHRSPSLLTTGGGWSVHICLWLLKGFTFIAKTVPLLISSDLRSCMS